MINEWMSKVLNVQLISRVRTVQRAQIAQRVDRTAFMPNIWIFCLGVNCKRVKLASFMSANLAKFRQAGSNLPIPLCLFFPSRNDTKGWQESPSDRQKIRPAPPQVAGSDMWAKAFRQLTGFLPATGSRAQSDPKGRPDGLSAGG
eukprot:scaffold71827_cov28-Prasinocladus_malaysianus.AAC.1